jgi:hypothetical protein
MVEPAKIMKKLINIAVACALVSQPFAQTTTPVAAAPAAPTSASLYRQGQMAEKSGDPVAAEGFYAKALKMDPNNASARYSLGQVKINAASISAKGREAKFGSVTLPVFQLVEASLQDALVALATIIDKESKEEVTPNFIIEDPKKLLADQKISLNLKGMPSKAVMKYLMDQSGAKARYDEHAVVVTAK